MKFVMIMLVFSSWDYTMQSKTEVGYFESRSACEKAAEPLRAQYTYHHQYICAVKETP